MLTITCQIIENTIRIYREVQIILNFYYLYIISTVCKVHIGATASNILTVTGKKM